MQNTVGRSLYERQKPSYFNLILNVIIVIFLIIFVAELFFNAYFTNIYVKGRSMMPTLTGAPNAGESAILPGGDYVFVNTRVKPKYFDIVVVESEDEFGVSYNIIKRAIAFGGDTVKIDRGQLYIKYEGDSEFTKIQEDYVSSDYNTPTMAVNTFEEHIVADGCMFLLGDNRDISEDSRKRGDFSLDKLVGVVPQWSLEYKTAITSYYTFFEFKLGLLRLGGSKIYGD